MVSVKVVSIVTLLYFGLLFAVAYFADKKRKAGQSIISNSYIYSLSLAVHYTSWTFYGLVGQAATIGVVFLAPYLGATLMAFTWWFLLRRMVRISKQENIVSIADFISCRYGKSPLLGGAVTVFTLVAIIPYIALQLKAATYTFDLLTTPPEAVGRAENLVHIPPAFLDTALIFALLLGLFGVLFGARHLDASERHEGLVAAVAMQSVVKLIALIAAGIFVTYGLFDGFTDIFTRFSADFPDRTHLFLLGTQQVPYSNWFAWIIFSMMALMFLPRQFHIMVVENSNEEHIKDAMWRFPTYTFLITLFVMPVALGGVIINNGDTSGADFFLINIPLQTGHPWLALVVFIGGFSASAGMVMVESVVLSTMILNHLIMPAILKCNIGASDLSVALVNIKRICIISVVLLGYLYYRFIGETYTLINIGVVSLIAATQFAPAIIGGLFWKRATRRGALAGLVLGFTLWLYTLLVPLFVWSGWLNSNILENGPFGIGFLRPLELFGLSGLDMLSHGLFWTMFFNLGAFFVFSFLTKADKNDIEQATQFVDIFKLNEEPIQRERMRKPPSVMEFVNLMTKFIGEKQAHAAIAQHVEDRQIDDRGSLSEFELPVLKRFTERTLAGSVGAAAARVIVDGYLAARGSEMVDVFDIFGTVTLSRTSSREQLSVLYEAAKTVSSGADIQTVQDGILALLMQQFMFDLCVIRILDTNRMMLTVRSQRGMSSKHLDESDREMKMETYAGEAFLTNSVIAVNDTEFINKPFAASTIHREGITSFVHAPITIDGEPIGLLSAFSRSMKGIFTDEVIQLFTSLAGQIGIALRNARQTEMLIDAKRQEKELQIARAIQLGLLPEGTPSIRGISLGGSCIPAREVGGDYYDFLPRSHASLDMVIADVSGHNVSAAIIMAETRAHIHARLKNIQNPAAMLKALNDCLYEDLTRSELFITMFYLNFDSSRMRLSFSNAGHNPPVVWRSNSQTCEWLDAEGLILGVKRDVHFEEKQVQLRTGDVLVLYTDGITEATNPDGLLFGESRLGALLEEYHALSPQQIVGNVLEEVRSFTGTQSLVDDVSLVVMKLEIGHGERS